MLNFRNIPVKIALLLLVVSNSCFSQYQFYSNRGAGITLGANLAFGTHYQRLGVNFHFYYVSNFFQSNSDVRLYFNLRAPGPRALYPELVVSQGVVFGFGTRDTLFNPFITPVSNQTFHKGSFAYSYNFYFNRRLTTQQTGIIAIEVNRVSLISENDLLARPYFDRFRTAAFLLQYQYLNIFQGAINCTMWTGQMGQKRGITNPDFNFGCYMDTTGAVYASTSHGLLSAQIKYNLGYFQNGQLNAGIDAEQVRNAVQNQFIHDMPFIPKRWNKARNCHLPMLDVNGNQYLEKETQKIRKPRPYFNLFTNANIFY